MNQKYSLRSGRQTLTNLCAVARSAGWKFFDNATEGSARKASLHPRLHAHARSAGWKFFDNAT